MQDPWQRARDYRRSAAFLRRQAVKSPFVDIRKEFLFLAEGYERLAASVEAEFPVARDHAA